MSWLSGGSEAVATSSPVNADYLAANLTAAINANTSLQAVNLLPPQVDRWL